MSAMLKAQSKNISTSNEAVKIDAVLSYFACTCSFSSCSQGWVSSTGTLASSEPSLLKKVRNVKISLSVFFRAFR